MCGIAGIIGNSPKMAVQRMVDAMTHRGPDDSGVWEDPESAVALGHTRLSIIDLSALGHQPMVDSSGRYRIVYNGEVYNYVELRRELSDAGVRFCSQTDTEVILVGYAHWGEGVVDRLRGMFAFGVWDSRERSLFLARDRFGIKPLVYAKAHSKFAFASELKVLTVGGVIEKRINDHALADIFTYGSVVQPRTIFDKVYTLPPGHWMKVKSDLTYIVEPYYELEDSTIRAFDDLDYKESVEQVRSLLEEAAKYHMVADVEVGAFLSGGIDSSAVVALMSRHASYPIKTFSVGFENQSEVDDERSIAQITANHLGCEHREVVVHDWYVDKIFDDFIDALDQPSIDGINTYIVSKAASGQVKVVLSGLGGDEIFGGYTHFDTILNGSAKNRNIGHDVLARMNALRPNRFTKKYEILGLHPVAAIDRIRQLHKNSHLSQILKSIPNKHYLKNYKENLDPVQKVSLHETEHYLRNTLLRDADALGMRCSLEVRPVLLDHKLVEYALSLPAEYKVDHGCLKRVFVDAVQDLIPEHCWQQKKKGFEMPFATWMNGILHDRFKEAVHSATACELYNKNCLSNLKKRVQKRSALRKDWLHLVCLCWIMASGAYL